MQKLTISSARVWTLANARKNRVKNLRTTQMYRQILTLLIRYSLEDITDFIEKKPP